MSKQLSDKLNAAFGDCAAFHVLVDSHWPEIDRALQGASSCVALLNAAHQFLVSGPALHDVQIEGGKVTRNELASLISAALGEHRAAGKRAVQALSGLTFGTNPDRLELEDLSDPLCVRCADQEPGSPPMPTECTCGKTVTSDTIAAELRNARMLVNYGHGDVRDEPDPLHEEAANTIERLERELAVEREIVAHLTQAVEQSPRPAEVRAMRDALARCEMWFSVHPEGTEMQDVCRAALAAEIAAFAIHP
jgi:hypothetical protein